MAKPPIDKGSMPQTYRRMQRTDRTCVSFHGSGWSKRENGSEISAEVEALGLWDGWLKTEGGGGSGSGWCCADTSDPRLNHRMDATS